MSDKFSIEEASYVLKDVIKKNKEIKKDPKILLQDFYGVKNIEDKGYNLNNLLYQVSIDGKHINEFMVENLSRIKELDPYEIKVRSVSRVIFYLLCSVSRYSKEKVFYLDIAEKTFDSRIFGMVEEYEEYVKKLLSEEEQESKMSEYDELLDKAEDIYKKGRIIDRYRMFKYCLSLEKKRGLFTFFIKKETIKILLERRAERWTQKIRDENENKIRRIKYEGWLRDNKDRVIQEIKDVEDMLILLGYKYEYKKYWE